MSEKEYDEIIAPMLADVAKQCNEFGMAMIARVEWEPDNGGTTQIGDNFWSASQRQTYLAAHSFGNIDKLCLQLLKFPGVENSMFLSRWAKKD